MDTVKDVFKRELRKKFVAKNFSIALFGSDSEHAKLSIKILMQYIIYQLHYTLTKIFGGIYNE